MRESHSCRARDAEGGINGYIKKADALNSMRIFEAFAKQLSGRPGMPVFRRLWGEPCFFEAFWLLRRYCFFLIAWLCMAEAIHVSWGFEHCSL